MPLRRGRRRQSMLLSCRSGRHTKAWSLSKPFPALLGVSDGEFFSDICRARSSDTSSSPASRKTSFRSARQTFALVIDA